MGVEEMGTAESPRKGEREVLDAVSGRRLMDDTRAISRWVRLAGEPDERQAFAYIEERLRELGLAQIRLEHEAFVSLPGGARLAVIAPEAATLPCITHAFSPSTAVDGVEGEVVYLNQGGPEDYAGLQAQGKIALIEGLARPAKTQRAEAAGVLAHVYIHGDYTNESSVSPLWGTPTPESIAMLPKTPSFSVDRASGARLKALIENGPLRIRLLGAVHTGWRTLPLLIATLPGEEEPERYVLFSNHVDSWHYGAMDNASGNATVLEVTRLMAAAPRRRGIRIIFWSGHSHGRFAGSTWYADTHWLDLYRHCVAHVTVDSPGGRDATVLEDAAVMAETRRLASDVIAAVAGRMLSGTRIGRYGDQSFMGIGVPALFGVLSQQDPANREVGRGLTFLEDHGGRGAGFGWWWHTTEDTMDKIDERLLVRDTRIYAATLFRLCNDPLLPLDYVPAAAEVQESLERYQAEARGRMDLSDALALANRLKDKTAHLAVRLQKVARHPDAGETERLNTVLMRLGRLLIPILYTIPATFHWDPGPVGPSLPGLAPISSLAAMDPLTPNALMLKTMLRRRLNGIEAALAAAADAVDEVLS